VGAVGRSALAVGPIAAVVGALKLVGLLVEVGRRKGGGRLWIARRLVAELLLRRAAHIRLCVVLGLLLAVEVGMESGVGLGRLVVGVVVGGEAVVTVRKGRSIWLNIIAYTRMLPILGSSSLA
jgi:hypothetical protein